MPDEKSFLEKQVTRLSERIEKLEEILREQIARIYKLEEFYSLYFARQFLLFKDLFKLF